MFSLRVPFDTSDIHKVLPGDSASLDGKSARIEIANHQHSLLVEGFASKDDAEAFLSRLETCFLYAAVVMQMPLSASFKSGRVQTFDKPTSVLLGDASITFDGPVNIDAHQACIFRSGDEPPAFLIAMTSQELRARSGDLIATLQSGLLSCAGDRFGDSKLKLAVELYVGHFREVSGTAKFVSLINVLEALGKPRHRPELVRSTLEGWSDEIEAKVKELECQGKSDELAAWMSLKSELRFRQQESIGMTLRRLVREALSGEPDVEECIHKLKMIYDARSSLVHTGSFPKDLKLNPLAEASILVRRVLLARITAMDISAARIAAG